MKEIIFHVNHRNTQRTIAVIIHENNIITAGTSRRHPHKEKGNNRKLGNEIALERANRRDKNGHLVDAFKNVDAALLFVLHPAYVENGTNPIKRRGWHDGSKAKYVFRNGIYNLPSLIIELARIVTKITEQRSKSEVI